MRAVLAVTLVMIGWLASAAPLPAAPLPPIAVVAAENFYGEVAARIGGPQVAVTSLIANPDADPHLFEVSASAARAVAKARLVVFNGAGYDAWMTKLLAAASSESRRVIVVADLLGKKPGANPHLWYDPAAMPALAKALAAALSALDPAHRAGYARRLQQFLQSLRPLDAKIADMRQRYSGNAVTASEPIFGYMAQALGLDMRNRRFQLAVMNNTEPGASTIAAFEGDLRQHKVKALIYNTQTTDPAVRRLVKLARASHIPVIGVSETQPAGETYQGWMLRQLAALDAALSGGAR